MRFYKDIEQPPTNCPYIIVKEDKRWQYWRSPGVVLERPEGHWNGRWLKPEGGTLGTRGRRSLEECLQGHIEISQLEILVATGTEGPRE